MTSPAAGPPTRTRSGRARWIAAVVVGVLVVIVGVIIVVQLSSGSDAPTPSDDVATLRATLDKVPLPTGTVLLHETAHEAHGDVAATVLREYRLPSAQASAQIVAGLRGAGYQPVNPQTHQVDPTMWQTATSTTGGDLYVLPPGKSGDGIELAWQHTRLDMSVQAGQVR